MQIRKLTPTDAVASAKLFAIAYESSSDVAAAEGQISPHLWGAFQQDRLCSQMISTPYQMRFAGQWVDMAGIGGVSTFPESRRYGAVRELFAHLFPLMREAGQVFSLLFPFAYGFYRKYAYEALYRFNRYTVPFSLFTPLPQHPYVRFYEPDDAIAPFSAIYNTFVAERNLAIFRDEASWRKRILSSDPWRERKYAYLIDDDQGVPHGYVIFQPAESKDGRCMRVLEWVVDDMQYLGSLFGFLKSFASHYQTIEFTAPTDLLPEVLFGEFHQLQCTTHWSGMVKIVDVAAALRLMRWPENAGALVLRVHDDSAAWNDGSYAISYGNGQVVVEASQLPYDLALDVRTLTRLLFGTLSFTDPTLQLCPGLDIATQERTALTEIFQHRPLYLNDYF